jgi:uncharacterized protein YggT (Ycf19 family)
MVDTTEQVTEKNQKLGDQRVMTREVSHDSREEHINRGVRILWFIIGIVITLLAVRFTLALIGANLENAFASFIYSITDPFVGMFRGLLQTGEFKAGVSRLEVETIVAAVVYALIGWGIASGMQLMSKKEQ